MFLIILIKHRDVPRWRSGRYGCCWCCCWEAEPCLLTATSLLHCHPPQSHRTQHQEGANSPRAIFLCPDAPEQPHSQSKVLLVLSVPGVPDLISCCSLASWGARQRCLVSSALLTQGKTQSWSAQGEVLGTAAVWLWEVKTQRVYSWLDRFGLNPPCLAAECQLPHPGGHERDRDCRLQNPEGKEGEKQEHSPELCESRLQPLHRSVCKSPVGSGREVPKACRKANVTPVLKKSKREDPGSYRLVCFISIPGMGTANPGYHFQAHEEQENHHRSIPHVESHTWSTVSSAGLPRRNWSQSSGESHGVGAGTASCLIRELGLSKLEKGRLAELGTLVGKDRDRGRASSGEAAALLDGAGQDG
ncbi:uncharacterized protein LOC111935664 [Cyanistes caeruleus]|uniref:uncharacterized protein LOC111935664 n=1 Tax=Cyanistes caeruleus TaxID=156563 RepID=UPI000CDB8D99|nr:uncharacterized protein LOC111935664 [Cyanistes caeruleus]